MNGRSLWWAGEDAASSSVYVGRDSGEVARACHRTAWEGCRSVVVRRIGPVDFEFTDGGVAGAWMVDVLAYPFCSGTGTRTFYVLANSAASAVMGLIGMAGCSGAVRGYAGLAESYVIADGRGRDGFEYERRWEVSGVWEEWTARENGVAEEWWYWEVMVRGHARPIGVVARSAAAVTELVARRRVEPVTSMNRLFFCHEVMAVDAGVLPRLYEVECENARGSARTTVRVVAGSAIDASLAATERAMPVRAECSWSAKPKEIREISLIEGRS